MNEYKENDGYITQIMRRMEDEDGYKPLSNAEYNYDLSKKKVNDYGVPGMTNERFSELVYNYCEGTVKNLHDPKGDTLSVSSRMPGDTYGMSRHLQDKYFTILFKIKDPEKQKEYFAHLLDFVRRAYRPDARVEIGQQLGLSDEELIKTLMVPEPVLIQIRAHEAADKARKEQKKKDRYEKREQSGFGRWINRTFDR